MLGVKHMGSDLQLERDETLVVEALCRVMARAKRWQTVMEVHSALLHIGLMAKRMKDEERRFISENDCGQQEEKG